MPGSTGGSLLRTQDDSGKLWAVYTDFNWIGQRHGITNSRRPVQMATSVVGQFFDHRNEVSCAFAVVARE